MQKKGSQGTALQLQLAALILLINWLIKGERESLDSGVIKTNDIFMFSGQERKGKAEKSAGCTRNHVVVCSLNSLMTFSLKVLAAKCCLLLPSELSALIMRD